MEHPPKQGLKLCFLHTYLFVETRVLMEHPPKQGLKLSNFPSGSANILCSFNGTSTKTRIETYIGVSKVGKQYKGFNGTSTKTRIETMKGNKRFISFEPF